VPFFWDTVYTLCLMLQLVLDMFQKFPFILFPSLFLIFFTRISQFYPVFVGILISILLLVLVNKHVFFLFLSRASWHATLQFYPSIYLSRSGIVTMPRWRRNWKSAQVVNSHLVCDPTIWQPGFDLPRQQWSLLNRFRTEQGHCSACRRKWRLTDTDLCPSGETQMMSHIIESCPLTKLNGDLSRLLRMKTLFRGWPVMVHDTHTRRRRRL